MGVGGAISCISSASYGIGGASMASDAPSVGRLGVAPVCRRRVREASLRLMTLPPSSEHGLGSRRLPTRAADGRSATAGRRPGTARSSSCSLPEQIVVVLFGTTRTSSSRVRREAAGRRPGGVIAMRDSSGGSAEDQAPAGARPAARVEPAADPRGRSNRRARRLGFGRPASPIESLVAAFRSTDALGAVVRGHGDADGHREMAGEAGSERDDRRFVRSRIRSATVRGGPGGEARQEDGELLTAIAGRDARVRGHSRPADRRTPAAPRHRRDGTYDR